MATVIRCVGFSLLYCLLFGWVLAATAQDTPSQEKAPWEWTLEERLEARYDPEKIQQRNQRAIEEWGPLPEKYKELASELRIDGQWNPELFMPWELFQWLMRRAFITDPELRQQWREERMARVEHLPLGEDFWERLETVGGPYLERIREDQRDAELRKIGHGALQPAEETDEEVQGPTILCELRADALARARQEFGRELFDRFLYEAVAYGLGTSHSLERDAWLLEYIERGCR